MTLQRGDPVGLPVIVSREQALAAGLTEGEVRGRLRSGRWRILVPGVYLRAELDAEDPFERERHLHALESIAAARRIADASVAYGSAALLHGMQLATGVPPYRELVVPPGRWNGIRAGTRVRTSQVGENDLVRMGGVAVTSPARTWVDIARASGLGDALSSGDSALRQGLATREHLATVIERHDAQRGLTRVARVLPLLDPARENALESQSFARFIEWNLPLPQCQVEIWDDRGLVGRVDFLWPSARVIGEADGRLKYTSAAVLYAEKQREDRLRACGYEVVRWGWNGQDSIRRRLMQLVQA